MAFFWDYYAPVYAPVRSLFENSEWWVQLYDKDVPIRRQTVDIIILLVNL